VAGWEGGFGGRGREVVRGVVEGIGGEVRLNENFQDCWSFVCDVETDVNIMLIDYLFVVCKSMYLLKIRVFSLENVSHSPHAPGEPSVLQGQLS
jgi:hypothetical protein